MKRGRLAAGPCEDKTGATGRKLASVIGGVLARRGATNAAAGGGVGPDGRLGAGGTGGAALVDGGVGGRERAANGPALFIAVGGIKAGVVDEGGALVTGGAEEVCCGGNCGVAAAVECVGGGTNRLVRGATVAALMAGTGGA